MASTTKPATSRAMPLLDYQQVSDAAAHPRSVPGSVGPFIGVLAAVLLLTALSCFFGRVCTAHAQGPDDRYDCTRLAGRRRCWWWRAARRPVRPAEAEQETKEPPELPLPEP